jgi:hypothetical protein
MPQTIDEFVRGTPFERELERLREVEASARDVLTFLEGPLAAAWVRTLVPRGPVTSTALERLRKAVG